MDKHVLLDRLNMRLSMVNHKALKLRQSGEKPEVLEQLIDEGNFLNLLLFEITETQRCTCKECGATNIVRNTDAMYECSNCDHLNDT